MYKAKLKHGKRIKDYLQTSSWQDIEERFNGRTLQAEESFELLWFVELVYRCPGGVTIQIQDQRNASNEPEPGLEASLEDRNDDNPEDAPTLMDEPEQIG